MPINFRRSLSISAGLLVLWLLLRVSMFIGGERGVLVVFGALFGALTGFVIWDWLLKRKRKTRT